MDQINVDNLLAQIKGFSEHSGIKSIQGSTGAMEGQALNFSEVLKTSLDNVNDNQLKASQMAEAFEKGDENTDLTQVMIQMQKARISFEALTQVRNRLISAYHEIMNMQI